MNYLIGISIGGRYHVMEQLGQGGMASVYKAFDTLLERTVALKLIRTDLYGAVVMDEILHRFKREAKSIAQLDHSSIVKVYDYGEHEGAPYLVMQYLSGGSLKDKAGKPISYQEAASLLLPVARALSYAHHQGIIHRDVKPANILLTRDGEVMLSDFGIAKSMEDASSTQLTGTGMGIGTPEYMPPEQWTGKPVIQTDIYALGVVFYELITGHKPYIADTPAALLLKVATDPLPRPRTYVPDLPERVEGVLFKALAKNPTERYANMDEFIRALMSLAYPGAGNGAFPQQFRSESRPYDSTILRQPQTPTIKPVQDTKSVQLEKRSLLSQPWLWLLGGAGLLFFVLIGIVLVGFVVKGMGKSEQRGTETALVALLETDEPTAENREDPESTRAFTESATDQTESTQTVVKVKTETIALTVTTSEETPTIYLTPTPGVGTMMISEADGMVMVYVPAGEFIMGSQIGDSDELPVHTVFLDAYWIDQTEVTNVMFRSFVNQTGYVTDIEKNGLGYVFNIHTEEWSTLDTANWQHPQGSDSSISGKDQYPVTQVSWNDAVAYCIWAGKRLPTEAEWEKAARGTDSRIYPWGNESPSDFSMNLADESLQVSWADNNINDGYEFASPVGNYSQGISPYGALDMAGNVFEWVADWYSSDYSTSASSNPQGISSGEFRVLRSGSWTSMEVYARTTHRSRYSPSLGSSQVGFRCVMSEK